MTRLLIWATLLSPVYCHGGDTPSAVVEGYISAILEERWDDAVQFWDPAAVEASKRLGIRYSGVPLKFDCASPVMYLLTSLHNSDSAFSIDTVIVQNHIAIVKIAVHTSSGSTTHRYYIGRDGERWVLNSSLLLLTQKWSTVETDYAEIHYTDSSRLNSYACHALDTFIENTGRELGLNDERLQYLRRVKIPYYLCDEDQIETLTGHKAHGITDLSTDAIITRHLPHRHEVTHLLINYAAADLGLFAAPFIQEGAAVYFGGRWGRSPATIRYMGFAIQRFELAGFDDLLTNTGFHRAIGNPDISYPLSGLLVESLLDQSDLNFTELYRSLTGTASEIQAWNKDEIIRRLEESGNLSWNKVIARYTSLADEISDGGILPWNEAPDGEPSAEITSRDSRARARFWDVGNKYYIEISGDGSNTGGILLMSDSVTERGYSSYLFTEHMPQTEYSGEIYGIRFSPNEVGAYDYLSNELIGIFVPSFTGAGRSEIPNHYDTGSKAYRFTVVKSLFRRELQTYSLTFVLQ